MQITLEADYAVRIIDCLARSQKRMSAKEIAENAGVTLRFSLKILRKLVTSGHVRSYKGAQGGYEIAQPLSQISLGSILSAIEGPIMLNRCQSQNFYCTKTGDKKCPYHDLFNQISTQLQDQLNQVSISDILEKDSRQNPAT